MLIQETGLQRELALDEMARRTPESEAALLERKIAMSFVYGSGSIEWLWNTNAYTTEANEVPVGALHADSTEKPEATVLRDFAKFAAAASPYLKNPILPAIAIVTSQAEQFSVMNELQLEAQRKAVRALGYHLHQPCYVIAENQIDKLGSPKLVILPSAQALRESTWQALLAYVRNGGNLLVTGPVSRDEHWHLVDRLTPLGISAHIEPITAHDAVIRFGTWFIPLAFDQQAQQSLESSKFDDGSSMKERAIGKGTLFLAAFPAELAEGPATADGLYMPIIDRANLKATFVTRVPLPAGILIFPIELQDAVLLVIESESDQNADLNIADALTGAQLKLQLPAQRAALAIIDKHTKQIVAKYGF